MMREHMIKPGQAPPTYEEILMSRGSTTNVRQLQTTMPWWNPRYWRKRVWAAISVVLIIIIVIAVAVGVTKAKNNAYPDYSELSYRLSESFQGESFFDNFNYFNTFDPAHGFVHYVSPEDAAHYNLTYASADSAIIRVDTSVGPGTKPADASTGRFSVRIESKKTYNGGLFVFDVLHTPHGCGTWPALWLTDPSNWPDNGEIDVMEATNQATDGNQMTLHTSDGCSMGVRRKQTGHSLHSDCRNSSDSNVGCGVSAPKSSFGTALNNDGGAVMAVEWREAGIRMWQFARSAIPSDITSKKPAPDTWGTATADFPSTDCNIGSHFKNNSIVANIDLCGDLVYATYGDSGCPSNCTDLVANHPEAFTDAYWQFGRFDIYQVA